MPTAPIEIEWPVFPDPAGQVTEQGGVVSMPLSYWLSIAEYAVDVDAVRQKIKIIN